MINHNLLPSEFRTNYDGDTGEIYRKESWIDIWKHNMNEGQSCFPILYQRHWSQAMKSYNYNFTHIDHTLLLPVWGGRNREVLYSLREAGSRDGSWRWKKMTDGSLQMSDAISAPLLLILSARQVTDFSGFHK